MATQPSIWRAVFRGQLELDDGKRRRPISVAELTALHIDLALRGHIPELRYLSGGERNQETRRHLRPLLSRPGRPAATYHAEWGARFQSLYASHCAQHDRYHVGNEKPPRDLEIAGLVALDDYIDHPERWSYDPIKDPERAARRVLMAVKRLS